MLKYRIPQIVTLTQKNADIEGVLEDKKIKFMAWL